MTEILSTNLKNENNGCHLDMITSFKIAEKPIPNILTINTDVLYLKKMKKKL